MAPPTSYTLAPRTCVQTLLHTLLKAALDSLHSLLSLSFDEQRARIRNRAALHSLLARLLA